MSPAGSITLVVRVTPRARGSAVEGLREGVLRVRVAAPPAEGAANAALVRLLAKALHVPPSAVEIVRGARSREKLVRLPAAAAAALAEISNHVNRTA